MYWHYQNLNEDRNGNPTRSIIRHGRCWLGKWNAEWAFLHHPRLAAEFGTDDDSGVTLSLAFLIGSIHIGYSGINIKNDRTIGIRFFDKAIWIDPWCDTSGWSSRVPWYRQGFSWHYIDTMLGSRKYSAEPIESRGAFISMPEGSYPCTVTIERRTWKRSRWPFPLVMKGAHVEVPGGVPIEGKGENSWDCGEDRTYSSSIGEVESVEDAIGKFVAGTLRTRRRHGVPASANTVHLSPAIAASVSI